MSYLLSGYPLNMGGIHGAGLFPAPPPPPRGGRAGSGLVPAALQLAALLRNQPNVLGGPETALLVHWLDTLSVSGSGDDPVGLKDELDRTTSRIERSSP
jgi:hypothetical protein